MLYQRLSPSSSNGSSDAYLLSLGSDSAFTVIFPDGTQPLGWSGRYERADSIIVFYYRAVSGGGPLGATGIVHGDTLDLKYNLTMKLLDFEDGLYIGTPR